MTQILNSLGPDLNISSQSGNSMRNIPCSETSLKNKKLSKMNDATPKVQFSKRTA